MLDVGYDARGRWMVNHNNLVVFVLGSRCQGRFAMMAYRTTV